jgi:hypothetical protein
MPKMTSASSSTNRKLPGWLLAISLTASRKSPGAPSETDSLIGIAGGGSAASVEAGVSDLVTDFGTGTCVSSFSTLATSVPDNTFVEVTLKSGCPVGIGLVFRQATIVNNNSRKINNFRIWVVVFWRFGNLLTLSKTSCLFLFSENHGLRQV